jgi:ankyrin repeat protein
MFEKDLILTKMKDDLDFKKVVKSVREYQIDINIQPDSTKNTFLHQAVLNKSKNQVHLLLYYGANVNIQNAEGDTPMHLAAKAGLQEICHMILNDGYRVDVNIQNAKGDTPMHLATIAGLQEICQMILINGYRVDIKNADGETALQIAAQVGLVKICTLLLRESADVNSQDSDLWTPLHTAVNRGYIDIAEILLNRGADINMKNSVGETPLSIAQKWNRPGWVELLTKEKDKFSMYGGNRKTQKLRKSLRRRF